MRGNDRRAEVYLIPRTNDLRKSRMVSVSSRASLRLLTGQAQDRIEIEVAVGGGCGQDARWT